MSKLNHNIAMCKVVASKAATLLLCLLASCIFLRAQDIRATRDFYLYFRVNQSVLDTNYRDNARILRQLEQFIHQDALAGNALFVYAYSSPEGSEKQNNSLSQKRAKTLASYLRTHFPEYIGHIEVAETGENWTGLRRAIETDNSLSATERQQILSILDNGKYSSSQKKARLKKTSAYRHLSQDIFPALRLTYFGVETLPDLVFEEPAIPLVDLPEFTQLDTTMPPVEPLAHKAVFQRRPILAISTNALYDLAITPNFAVEVPIGQRWSVWGEYTFPWWVTSGNDRAWQILKWDLGTRYWFSKKDKNDPMDVLRGHFVGIDLSAGYYDIEPHHNGYQGEAVAASLEYGYAWSFGKKKAWRLEACLGLGWMGTQYRYYQATEDDKHLLYNHTARFNWVGPTKLALSIKYVFHKKKAVKTTSK